MKLGPLPHFQERSGARARQGGGHHPTAWAHVCGLVMVVVVVVAVVAGMSEAASWCGVGMVLLAVIATTTYLNDGFDRVNASKAGDHVKQMQLPTRE